MSATDPDLPQLDESSATSSDISKVVNTLTTKFVEQGIASRLDTALSLESDDWAANCYMQRKVC